MVTVVAGETYNLACSRAQTMVIVISNNNWFYGECRYDKDEGMSTSASSKLRKTRQDNNIIYRRHVDNTQCKRRMTIIFTKMKNNDIRMLDDILCAKDPGEDYC